VTDIQRDMDIPRTSRTFYEYLKVFNVVIINKKYNTNILSSRVLEVLEKMQVDT